MTMRSLTLPIMAVSFAASCLTAQAQTIDERLADVATFFERANVVSGPDAVNCTLSGGAASTCFSITVKAGPQSYTPGPWCPTQVGDGADKGGIWIHGGEIHDVTGAFIANLAEFYGDANWQLVDPETGNIKYTGTLEACEAAARPDVDPAYQNHCVQCLPEYMPEDATITYVIPLEPVTANQSQRTNLTGSGVASNGVRLDGPAPLDAILGAYTIAPFDDCGGHVNIHVGYHYHAVTDCLGHDHASESTSDHGPQIGIAMDGYGIFLREVDGVDPDDLDICNGHETADLPYHYHAGAPGSNAILGCLVGEAGCVSEDPNGACDASARPRRP